MHILAAQPDPTRLVELLPDVLDLLREKLSLLKKREVPLKDLLITQTLSRELTEYRVASPLARAALQLQNTGRSLRMGQRVRYVHTMGEPGVFAWDLPEIPDPRKIDVPRYHELLFRAAFEILQPLGISREFMKDCLLNHAGHPFPPVSSAAPKQSIRPELPLFSSSV